MSDIQIKKDKFGTEVKVGDTVAYSESGSSSPVVNIGIVIRETPKKIIIQDMHNTSYYSKNKGELRISGGKDSRSTINLSNHPALIPNIMENYVAPFRHLKDDEIKTLVQMFKSSNKEDVELAYQLMDTYKLQANE